MYQLALYRSKSGKPIQVFNTLRSEYVSIVDDNESDPADEANIIKGFEFVQSLKIIGDATRFPTDSTLIGLTS